MGASLVGGGAGVTVNVDRTVAAGTHIENEPIIKSDGAGEVMQWQPSDGGTDGVFINQHALAGHLQLGVGVSPATAGYPLEVGATTTANSGMAFVNTGGTIADNAVLTKIAFKSLDSDLDADHQIVAKIVVRAAEAYDASDDNASDMEFYTSASAENVNTSTTPDLTISSTGTLTQAGSSHAFLKQNAAAGTSNHSGSLLQHGGADKWLLKNDGAADSFKIYNYAAAADALTITAANAVTIPGSVTIGSLDIGHGAGGEDTNTAVGKDALNESHASSVGNTAIGHDALGRIDLDSADFNTAVGQYAGFAIEGGKRNTAIGRSALDETVSGDYNSAVGYGALGGVCVDENTAVGYAALNAYTGSNGTAVGGGAGRYATSASEPTAIGKSALTNSSRFTGRCCISSCATANCCPIAARVCV